MKKILYYFIAGLGAMMILFACGCVVRTNSVRIGYVESNGSGYWKASYVSMSGTMTNTLKVSSGVLDIAIVTDSGSVSLEITDEKGNNVYRGNDLSTCTFSVKTAGKTKIVVKGQKHEGSFSFTTGSETLPDNSRTEDDKNSEGNGNVTGFVSISMEDAKEIFKNTGSYIILDVRRADEYVGGHIPGAINIANESITDTEPEGLPDKNQTIYVYCRSGNRSKQAAGKLVAMGYKNIFEIGGIIDWDGEIEK